MNTIDDFFRSHIDLQKEISMQIIREWGTSSVILKKWLNIYHPEIMQNPVYSKKAGLNADVFLPYRRNALWYGEEAISRLKLAVKAEVVIVFSVQDLSDLELQVIYKTQCLRLWTRINSLKTRFSFEQFKNLVNNCYKEVIENWNEQVEFLLNKQPKFKFKRKQTLYHYTENDFSIVNSLMTLSEAYNYWMKYTFPTLLENYKNKKIKEFGIESKLNEWSPEFTEKKFKQLKKDLELIKIKEPTIQAFAKLLQRNGITYNKKQRNEIY